MVFVSIPSSQNQKEIHLLEQHLRQGKPAFVLIYMEGCGPCNATRPEWGKLKNTLSPDPNVMIADIDQEVLPLIKSLKESPAGFPTMLYINGNKVEHFEEGRDVDSFVQWIKSKNSPTLKQSGGKRSKKDSTRRKGFLTRKKKVSTRKRLSRKKRKTIKRKIISR